MIRREEGRKGGRRGGDTPDNPRVSAAEQKGSPGPSTAALVLSGDLTFAPNPQETPWRTHTHSALTGSSFIHHIQEPFPGSGKETCTG